jgi:hypothetical protein
MGREGCTAAAVAEEMLAGVAGGRFTIIPGLDGRMTVAAQRWVPSVVRWYSDMAMKSAK